MVMFRFPSPLDFYSGQFKQVSGSFSFGDDLSATHATGKLTVNTNSITMGDEDLDLSLVDRTFLASSQYPQSTFTIERFSTDSPSLAFGSLMLGVLEGHFFLKGKTIPIKAATEIEPVINADGEPRLLIRANWQINVRNFDIAEADGPEPAKHTVIIDTNYQLHPMPASKTP